MLVSEDPQVLLPMGRAWLHPTLPPLHPHGRWWPQCMGGSEGKKAAGVELMYATLMRAVLTPGPCIHPGNSLTSVLACCLAGEANSHGACSTSRTEMLLLLPKRKGRKR